MCRMSGLSCVKCQYCHVLNMSTAICKMSVLSCAECQDCPVLNASTIMCKLSALPCVVKCPMSVVLRALPLWLLLTTLIKISCCCMHWGCDETETVFAYSYLVIVQLWFFATVAAIHPAECHSCTNTLKPTQKHTHTHIYEFNMLSHTKHACTDTNIYAHTCIHLHMYAHPHT